MTSKSKWIETEVEQNGKLYLLPIRCQLWARGDRIRMVVQCMNIDTKTWHDDGRSKWFSSKNAERLSNDKLNEAAQSVADQLIEPLMKEKLHPDWIIEDSIECSAPSNFQSPPPP